MKFETFFVLEKIVVFFYFEYVLNSGLFKDGSY